jgi:hypothetical protein
MSIPTCIPRAIRSRCDAGRRALGARTATRMRQVPRRRMVVMEPPLLVGAGLGIQDRGKAGISLGNRHRAPRAVARDRSLKGGASATPRGPLGIGAGARPACIGDRPASSRPAYSRTAAPVGRQFSLQPLAARLRRRRVPRPSAGLSRRGLSPRINAASGTLYEARCICDRRPGQYAAGCTTEKGPPTWRPLYRWALTPKRKRPRQCGSGDP